jgi:long-subunit fatty acid transport protein
VATISILHEFNKMWFLKARLWWSNWSVSKQVLLTNSAIGNVVAPLNWQDTWSVDGLLKHTLNDKLSLFGQLVYDTNPVPAARNVIVYPSGPPNTGTGTALLGFELNLTKQLSVQVVYGYSMFLPNKILISQPSVNGYVTLGQNTCVVNFKYAY